MEGEILFFQHSLGKTTQQNNFRRPTVFSHALFTRQQRHENTLVTLEDYTWENYIVKFKKN